MWVDATDVMWGMHTQDGRTHKGMSDCPCARRWYYGVGYDGGDTNM